MKKLMLVTVVTFASVSALASKARLNALQNAQHIVDIQEVWQREPDQAVNYEAATVEFGGNQGTSPDAEGGFIRKMGDSAWSMYLGRSSTTYQNFVNGIAANFTGAAADVGTAFTEGNSQTNPLQLSYASKMGDIAWGAGLIYTSSDNKTAQTFGTATNSYSATVKQNIAGLLLGANNGVWDVQARVGLIGETEAKVTGVTGAVIPAAITGFSTGDKFETNSTGSFGLSGGYRMDTMYYYGSASIGSGEVKLEGAKLVDLTENVYTVGAINSLKKDGTDFFYGASVIVTERENKGSLAATKVNSTRVPLLVGVETEVNSWMTLRGALTQTLNALSSTKTRGSSAGTFADDTTTTVGAGFKWGRATIDTVLGTGGTGTFGLDDDGDNFAQASVTYNF